MSGLQFCADVFNIKSSQLFLVERCWSIFNLKKKGHILVIVSGSWCAVRLWDIQQKRCSPCSNLVSVYPSCLHTSSSCRALYTSLLPGEHSWAELLCEWGWTVSTHLRDVWAVSSFLWACSKAWLSGIELDFTSCFQRHSLARAM